jgi:hypothetical protein
MKATRQSNLVHIVLQHWFTRVFYFIASFVAVQVDARLQLIGSGSGEALLAQVWRSHCGTWCRGVNWDRYGLDLLTEICR